MTDLQLYITEVFASVQGETSLTGLPTTFIRLASCNLRCSWCDTTYSFGRGTPASIEHLVLEAENNGCQFVCITGGEPLLQPYVHQLIDKLLHHGYVISLETGGSLPIHEVDSRVLIILDIKCPGSGMSHKNHWENLHIITKKDEIKFVLTNEEDYIYAKEICLKYNLFKKTPHILLSPVHGVLDPQILVGWILRDKLQVRLNLQVHKYIWTPTTQGV
ncbi:MAG: radical SAM protein [Parachlamydiaceae bacterium]|nr:radical SAM protein [Parachlamydiaceae bacterium]